MFRWTAPPLVEVAGQVPRGGAKGGGFGIGGPSPDSMSTRPSLPKVGPRGDSAGLNLPLLFLVSFSDFFSVPLSVLSPASGPPHPCAF